MHQKAYFLADGIFWSIEIKYVFQNAINKLVRYFKKQWTLWCNSFHKTSPFPDARITIALMLLEQYSKLFAESDQGDFRTIGGAKYCLSAKITFRILRITAYTIVCR